MSLTPDRLECRGGLTRPSLTSLPRTIRIVVSADTDFGTILARRQLAKPSFVLLRRTQNLGPDEVGSLLVRNLPAFERDLNEGAIVVIDDTVARVRRLPITPV